MYKKLNLTMMQTLKLSAVALIVSATCNQFVFANENKPSSQDEASGFFEGSDLSMFTRAFYLNRDYRHGAENSAQTNRPTGSKNGYSEESALGIQMKYSSGFTKGTVGFGLDAFTMTSIRLDSGRGRVGTGLLAQSTDDGQAQATETKAGAAARFRISNTGVKYGNQTISNPVFSTDDTRLLPEVATGTYLVSSEFENLQFDLGRFTALNAKEQTERDTLHLKAANIYGADYQITDNFRGGLHHSNVEDYWKKTYLNLNYNLPINDTQSVNFDVNGYHTKGIGDQLAGEADNNLWSLMTAYTLGAHRFSLGYQRSTGDAAYQYGVDGGSTIYVANSVQYTDFVSKDEKSYQVRYDLDMADYGIPGLSFLTRFVKGGNIDTGIAGAGDGREHEFNFETAYVIQHGKAKDLSFRLRSAVYRANSQQNETYVDDANDVRFIVEYPLDLL